LLRERLTREGVVTAEELRHRTHGDAVHTAGLVITRQRPMTASGVTFVTLEDETGHINLIVWLNVAERRRSALIESRLLEVSGELQREGEVLHVIVKDMRDRSVLLGNLQARSRDFH
jgi:error-prone DNA polymerase